MQIGSNHLRNALDEVVELLISGRVTTTKELEQIKRQLSRKYGLSATFRNSEILAVLPQDAPQYIRNILRRRAVRNLSGIAVVAVMTTPASCPGNCIYCPGGIYGEKPTPKSYTGREPAALRAEQNQFDGFRQTSARLSQLEAIGHDTTKVHLIIMGGTLLAQPNHYQEHFFKDCLDAIVGYRTLSLEASFNEAEHSHRRLVGVTYETRPDFCHSLHVDRMLSLGGTWVEIGVQTLRDSILQRIRRGHTLADTVEAIQIARDSGLKVTLHVMPNLFATPTEDLQMFQDLFSSSQFQPDALKIYPLLVLKGTPLYELWKKGDFVPYPEDEVVKVLARAKTIIPPYVRIQRIQRDIPAGLIQDGVFHSNLRELVHERMQMEGKRCRCIRCREIGHVIKKGSLTGDLTDPELKRRQYNASGGEELFLSFEDGKNDVIFGFLRLRIPSDRAHRLEVCNVASALVRELHIYGEAVGVGSAPDDRLEIWQHKGLGKKLLSYAEKVAKEEYDAKQLLITSGIGVRAYYRKLGFDLRGSYMGKNLY
ncbi:MAG: tRNA uridine(34) 5-carboxymethylaminomethyl modification radical SAM/GNAT enzyme Elp3 [Candidatus Hodarchaeota archaeon]